MKKSIFITVRTGSTRLPQKALLPILGKPTIEHLIDRVKRSHRADGIVLCTTQLPEDLGLCKLAEKNGIEYYRGSTEDKLARWQGAAQKFGVEFLVTADGDDLFCEPELIDLAFDQYDRLGGDFIESKGLVCGAFTYGIKVTALNQVCDIKDTDDTEMMWLYFTDTGLFKTQLLQNVPEIFKRPEIRMTLDYEDDLRFFTNIIEHFAGLQKEFNLRDIIQYLDQNPGVISINQHRQTDYLENQKRRVKLVLKGADQ